MKLVFNNNLEIIEKNDFSLKQDARQRQFYISGDILAAFDGTHIHSVQVVVQMIQDNIKDIDAISRIVRTCLGNFYLLVEKDFKQILFCSVQSPGLFYFKQNNYLIISDDELALIKMCKGNGLNEMILLGMFVNFRDRHPFLSLFKGVRKIVGGQGLSIKKGLELKPFLFIKKAQHELYDKKAQGYQDFVRNFEAVAKIIADTTKGRKKYLSWSAGADSTAFLIAFLKFSREIHPFHSLGKSNELRRTLSISEKFGIDPTYFSFGPDNLNFPTQGIVDLFKKSYRSAYDVFLFNQLRIPLFNFLQTQPKTSEAGSRIVFDLNNMDILYSVASWRGSLNDYKLALKGKVRPKDALHGMNASLKNLSYTRFWHRAVTDGRSQRYRLPWSVVLGKGKFTLPNNAYEYLLAMSLNKKPFPMMPKNILPPELNSLSNEYLRFKADTLLAPMLESNSLLLALKNNEVTPRYLNHLSRVFAYSTIVQGGRSLECGDQRIADFESFDPSSEGPLVDFFLDFQMDTNEALHYKNFEYQYLDNELGFSFDKLQEQSLELSFVITRAYKKIIKGQATHNSHYNKLKAIFSSVLFKEHFKKLLNPKKSLLLANIKNPILKNYIYRVYNDAYQGNINQLTGARVEQMVNLELFLKNL